MKELFRKVGASENTILKSVAWLMRWPIQNAQFQLLELQKQEKGIIRLIRNIIKDGRSLMWPTEMMQIYYCINAVKGRTGDFAEVGVFAGRSAKLICEVKDSRVLHLFDTFQGLPASEAVYDRYILREKAYAAELDSVAKYLNKYKNIFFYKGVFPETAKHIADKLFAFVHLDVDLYGGTKGCLKFFYPRMVNGGIILVHDYSNLIGVRKAVDEFFADRDESVVELSTSQCMILKSCY